MVDAPNWSWTWVVTYSTPVQDSARVMSRPFNSGAAAAAFADRLRRYAPEMTCRLTYSADLTLGEVFPAFLAAVGGEVAPHVVRIQDGNRVADVCVDPAEVVCRAYAKVDPHDDSGFPHTTGTVQPRRLGVTLLVANLEDELAARGRVADVVRGQ